MYALAQAGEHDKETFRVLTAAALKSAREAEAGGLLLRSCSLAELADWAWALARFDLKTVRDGVGGWVDGWVGGRVISRHWLEGDGGG